MNKKISIVVPVYNVENYLERCIKSLINQSYQNLEIILVDDGSTDSSGLICKKWAEQDQRIVFVKKQNGGLSDARNAGIKNATGSYLLFVDSDDFIKENIVAVMVQRLQETEADICICDMEYLYDDGRVSFSSGGDFDQGNVQENPTLIKINNSACNKLFARYLFEDVQFPVGKYYEDLATVPILLFKAKKIVKVNEVGYIYYQRTGSIAHSANRKIFEIYDAIQGCIDYIEKQGQYLNLVEELKKLYILHGLELTTLRIKDFDDSALIEEYLQENMKHLEKFYPNYRKDSMMKSYSLKKRLIFSLMSWRKMKVVKKIYGR